MNVKRTGTEYPEPVVRYRFHTREIGEFDIHYRALRDRNQYDDDSGETEALGIPPASWPLYGVVWQAGEVLAKLMSHYDIDSRRILEVGCGFGLASLVLNKRHADITATDIHPGACRNLQYNTELNQDPDIPFLRCAWKDPRDEKIGLFDLIIASDVLFEPGHAIALAKFIELYAKPRCEVLLTDAGRGYGNHFTREMEARGYKQTRLETIAPITNPEKYKGRIQRYRRS